MRTIQKIGLGVVAGSRGVAAADFLRSHSDLQPNLYNDMADGSYLTWAVPERFPVRVDPRLEVYGEERLKRLLDNSPEEFIRAQQEGAINVVLVNSRRNSVLGGWLNASPDWVLVHLDERNVIFVRDIPQHADLIRQFRIDPAKPWKMGDATPDEAPSAWRRALGGVNRPWSSLGMTRAFLMLGAMDNAERFLRKALAACPQDGETRLSLSQFERSRGNQKQVASLLEGLPLT